LPNAAQLSALVDTLEQAGYVLAEVYGKDGLLQIAGGWPMLIRQHPDRFPAIVIFPQSHADGTPGWQAKGGEAVLSGVYRTIAEFHGDP